MANKKTKNKKTQNPKSNSQNKKGPHLKGEQREFVLQKIAELEKDTGIVELFKERFPGKSIVYQTVNYYRHHSDYQEEIRARRDMWRNGYLDAIPLANKTKRLEELTKLYNSLTQKGDENIIRVSNAETIAVALKILAQIQKETEGILGKKGLDGNPADLPGGLNADLTATIPLGRVGSDKLQEVIDILQDGASEKAKS